MDTTKFNNLTRDIKNLHELRFDVEDKNGWGILSLEFGNQTYADLKLAQTLQTELNEAIRDIIDAHLNERKTTLVELLAGRDD